MIQSKKPAVKFAIPNRILYQYILLIAMWSFCILWPRINPFFQPPARIEGLPMSRAKFNSMMAGLPDRLRSSAKTVAASYNLFSGAQVRFVHFPVDSTGPMGLAQEVTEIILDEKLCLYFYRDPQESDYWEYDGFESGDYANPEPESLEFRVIE